MTTTSKVERAAAIERVRNGSPRAIIDRPISQAAMDHGLHLCSSVIFTAIIIALRKRNIVSDADIRSACAEGMRTFDEVSDKWSDELTYAFSLVEEFCELQRRRKSILLP